MTEENMALKQQVYHLLRQNKMLRKDSHYAKMIPTSLRCNFCGADNNIFSSEEIADTQVFSPGLSDDSDQPSDVTTDVSSTGNPR